MLNPFRKNSKVTSQFIRQLFNDRNELLITIIYRPIFVLSFKKTSKHQNKIN